VAEPFDISERRGLGLAAVMARKGIDAAALGPDFPTGPQCVTTGGTTVVGVGPGVWLVVGDARGEAWPGDWERRLADRCSISDQSGAYVVLRLSGPSARALLQRGVAIDLHPDVFVAGSAATTAIAHIGVILWRPDAGDAFEFAVFRSYLASFRRWIAAQTL
jgi:heterotetrameric sarcosine oxidase gamma subunit